MFQVLLQKERVKINLIVAARIECNSFPNQLFFRITKTPFLRIIFGVDQPLLGWKI